MNISPQRSGSPSRSGGDTGQRAHPSWQPAGAVTVGSRPAAWPPCGDSPSGGGVSSARVDRRTPELALTRVADVTDLHLFSKTSPCAGRTGRGDVV